MVDFVQAVKWMEEGKKVTYNDLGSMYMEKASNLLDSKTYKWNDGSRVDFIGQHFLNDTWRVLE